MLQNVHRIEGDVTYISLTRGKEAIIDTADVERVLQVRWYAEHVQKGDYYYVRGRYDGKPIFLHRFLLDAKPDEWVDHINFNTLDNRRENLRLITPSGNRLHQRRRVGQSGMRYISVTHRADGHTSYFVTMMREGVRKSKGYPYTPEGLQAAQELVAKWEEDFSYEPLRTVQRRPLRSNLLTSKTGKTGIRGVSVHTCKPTGFMYVFRCHWKTCPIAKYFPHTEEGLEAARLYAEAHYAAMKRE